MSFQEQIVLTLSLFNAMSCYEDEPEMKLQDELSVWKTGKFASWLTFVQLPKRKPRNIASFNHVYSIFEVSVSWLVAIGSWV